MSLQSVKSTAIAQPISAAHRITTSEKSTIGACGEVGSIAHITTGSTASSLHLSDSRFRRLKSSHQSAHHRTDIHYCPGTNRNAPPIAPATTHATQNGVAGTMCGSGFDPSWAVMAAGSNDSPTKSNDTQTRGSPVEGEPACTALEIVDVYAKRLAWSGAAQRLLVNVCPACLYRSLPRASFRSYGPRPASVTFLISPAVSFLSCPQLRSPSCCSA